MASFALSKHDEDFIRKQVESGRYDNASDVVHAGLQMLEDSEVASKRWLEEMPSRLVDVRQNPEAAIPLEDAFSRLEARHRANASVTK